MFIYIDKYVQTYLYIFVYFKFTVYNNYIYILFVKRVTLFASIIWHSIDNMCDGHICVYTHTVKMCIIGMGSEKGQKSG